MEILLMKPTASILNDEEELPQIISLDSRDPDIRFPGTIGDGGYDLTRSRLQNRQLFFTFMLLRCFAKIAIHIHHPKRLRHRCLRKLDLFACEVDAVEHRLR